MGGGKLRNERKRNQIEGEARDAIIESVRAFTFVAVLVAFKQLGTQVVVLASVCSIDTSTSIWVHSRPIQVPAFQMQVLAANADVCMLDDQPPGFPGQALASVVCPVFVPILPLWRHDEDSDRATCKST